MSQVTLRSFGFVCGSVTLNVKVRKEAKEKSGIEEIAQQVANGQIGLHDHEHNVPGEDTGKLEQLDLSDERTTGYERC